MRFVIFDDETIEPITVVNLPGIAERDIFERMGGVVRVAVMQPLSPTVPDESLPSFNKPDVVELRFERLARRGQFSLMCFTREAELAMLLDPDFLPGQHSRVRELETQNKQIAEMVMKAIADRLG